MELKARTTEEYIIGAEKEMQFDIDTDNHIIFEILRDKMYSDKIGAVAREVASNSRDANREAGREDVPVIVQIVKPNKFASIGHQSIVFSDNGIGITPDRMADIFIKYAASTKRDSNKETGGFGLGAKTPFAYSDTFTVITVCDWARPIVEKKMVKEIIGAELYTEMVQNPTNYPKFELVTADEETQTVSVNIEKDVVVGHEDLKRWKYTYNAIIDESNKGKMIQFDSEIVDEETGTKIVVPIKTDDDRFEFERKVIKATQYWGESIEYKGFHKERPEITYIIDEPEFAIVKSDADERYAMLIDGINYPLNTGEAEISDKGVSQAYVILLKFDTGELTISANREAVQYDKESVDLIKARYEFVKQRLREMVQEYTDKLPSYIEACKFAYYTRSAKPSERAKIEDDVLRVIAESLNKNKEYYYEKPILGDEDDLEITYDGQPVVGSYKLKYHKVAYVREPRGFYNTKVDYSTVQRINITETLVSSPIYMADVAKNKRRNETIWEDHKTFLLVFPIGQPSIEQTDELHDFLTKFELETKSYKSVPMKPIVRNYASGSGAVAGQVTVNYRRVWGNSSYDSGVLKVDKKTKKFVASELEENCYLAIPSLSDMRNYVGRLQRDKVNFVEKHGGIKTIIVNSTAAKNWISHTGITTLEEEYQKILAKHKPEWDRLTKLEIFENAFREVFSDNPEKYEDFAAELEPLLPKCMQGLGILTEATRKSRRIKFVRQDLKFDQESLENKIRNTFEVKYPMLMPYLEKATNWYNRHKSKRPRQRKIIQDYIKAMQR